jgi:hypothetical protein
MSDGYVRMTACEFVNMMAFGWNDKNRVQFVSIADGYKARTMVQRNRKKFPATVSYPTAVPVYNKNMLGVDRHDQVR